MRKFRVRWDGERWRMGTALFLLTCRACSRPRIMGLTAKRCDECRHRWRLQRMRVCAPAQQRVRRAIRAGRLPALDGSVKCTDCDRPAVCYDHREYARPLEVSPVCQRCNILRGPAVDSVVISDPLNGRRKDEMSAALFPARKLRVMR